MPTIPGAKAVTCFPDPQFAPAGLSAWLRKYGNYTWANIQLGNADDVSNSKAAGPAGITSYYWENRWQMLGRCFIIFETHHVKPEWTLHSGKVIVHVYDLQITEDTGAAFGFTGCSPADPTYLTKYDWTKVSSVAYTESIPIESIVEDHPNEFKLSPAGLNAIGKGGISPFCFREMKFDVPNEEPEWAFPWLAVVDIGLSYDIPIYTRPRLELIYSP